MEKPKPNVAGRPSLDLVLAFLVFVACILFALFQEQAEGPATVLTGLGLR